MIIKVNSNDQRGFIDGNGEVYRPTEGEGLELMNKIYDEWDGSAAPLYQTEKGRADLVSIYPVDPRDLPFEVYVIEFMGENDKVEFIVNGLQALNELIVRYGLAKV
ncbi:hypothetical protein [Photobacterium indicum]|uniref:Uncharacterized protein n=1 Tax=Photobacterium indicum TaxID=81447 RepID=A0A2T3L3D0_9GAMM|nr:hypothetical protein [Photobacterium indicum]PSV43600.1 hypothetical protein C9J47_22290 [Photobacterium indicum]